MNFKDPDALIEAEIAAAEARGEDPYSGQSSPAGTNAPAAPATPAAQAAAPAAATEAPDHAAPEGVRTPEANAALADEEALRAIADDTPELGAQPLQFNVQMPADYKAARATLLAEKAEAMGKLMDGELDAQEYAAIESRVMDSLEDLSAQRIRAETLLEANHQTSANAQGAAIQALIVRAKDEVPYATDAKAQKQFDMALKLQLEDPENAGKPFAHAVNLAHKDVLAMRGIQPHLPAGQGRPDRTAPPPPVTLSGLPAAAMAGASTPAQVMATLSGEDFERAYEALPESERLKMLR